MATDRTFTGFGIAQKRMRLSIPSAFISFFQISSRTGTFWAGVRKELKGNESLDSLQRLARSLACDDFIVYNKKESTLLGLRYCKTAKEWLFQPWHNLIPPCCCEFREDSLKAEETLDNVWLFLDAVTASRVSILK